MASTSLTDLDEGPDRAAQYAALCFVLAPLRNSSCISTNVASEAALFSLIVLDLGGSVAEMGEAVAMATAALRSFAALPTAALLRFLSRDSAEACLTNGLSAAAAPSVRRIGARTLGRAAARLHGTFRARCDAV